MLKTTVVDFFEQVDRTAISSWDRREGKLKGWRERVERVQNFFKLWRRKKRRIDNDGEQGQREGEGESENTRKELWGKKEESSGIGVTAEGGSTTG